MQKQAYVYILASSFQKLYIGVTTEIEIRIKQHKEGRFEDSFTSRYKIDRLVYLERFTEISPAIAREKQLKRWYASRRSVSQNPTWQDLSQEWGIPITLPTEQNP